MPEVNYALFSANGAHVVHLGVNTCQGRGNGAFATEISISELVRIRLEILIHQGPAGSIILWHGKL